MSSSVSLPLPTPHPVGIRPVWRFAAEAPLRGLAQVREKGGTLAWDEANWLYLIDPIGRLQAQVPAPLPLAAACAADDGSCYAAAGSGGEVWWLAPDLMPRWRRTLLHRMVAAALDPFGQYLAVADAAGQLTLFDRRGRALGRASSPRPFWHLAFVPETPLLAASADLGLVAGFDLSGRFVWRDGLATQVGALAVSGSGDRIVLACFSEGLRCYTSRGVQGDNVRVTEPCRLVSLSYDGQRILVGGLSNRLLLLDITGRILADQLLEESLAALALGPLGDRAVVALTGGRLVGLEFTAS